jgi:hypothetical protein
MLLNISLARTSGDFYNSSSNSFDSVMKTYVSTLFVISKLELCRFLEKNAPLDICFINYFK